MSQSRVERFLRLLKDKPEPKEPVNENDAPAKADEDRALSDAELERVSGGTTDDWGRGRE